MYTVSTEFFTATIDNGIWSGDREIVSLAVELESVENVSEHLWPDTDYRRAKLVEEFIGGAIQEGNPSPRKLKKNMLY